MARHVELGLDTFGDVTVDASGTPLHHAQVIRNLVDEAVLADEVGVDFIGVGEHHRDDFAVSAPEMVLAAIASRTERIRLGTAVTVLSSDDPVRVFQRFSTLDAVSNGRAEAILGRGSFTESFPLFGFDLGDYEVLYDEKLALFVELLKQQPVTWSGSTRASLTEQSVYPPVEHGPLKTWVAVGGSPQSVVRAASHGLPLMLAIIGGAAERFEPFARLHREALVKFGQQPQPVGAHSPGYVAATDEQAREEYFPHYAAMTARIGRERGWGAMTKSHFIDEVEHGALLVSSPETVAAKIVRTVQALDLDRLDLKYSSGTLPHELSMTSIGLYGREVIPAVREQLAG